MECTWLQIIKSSRLRFLSFRQVRGSKCTGNLRIIVKSVLHNILIYSLSLSLILSRSLSCSLILSHALSFSLILSLCLSFTLILSHSLSFSLIHSHSLSLSLSHFFSDGRKVISILVGSSTGPRSSGTYSRTFLLKFISQNMKYLYWYYVIYRNGGTSFQLAPAFVALQGYHASLKTCLAGLVLVCDMNVSAFLSGNN